MISLMDVCSSTMLEDRLRLYAMAAFASFKGVSSFKAFVSFDRFIVLLFGLYRSFMLSRLNLNWLLKLGVAAGDCWKYLWASVLDCMPDILLYEAFGSCDGEQSISRSVKVSLESFWKPSSARFLNADLSVVIEGWFLKIVEF